MHGRLYYRCYNNRDLHAVYMQPWRPYNHATQRHSYFPWLPPNCAMFVKYESCDSVSYHRLQSSSVDVGTVTVSTHVYCMLTARVGRHSALGTARARVYVFWRQTRQHLRLFNSITYARAASIGF